jgi:hypothetical protein
MVYAHTEQATLGPPQPTIVNTLSIVSSLNPAQTPQNSREITSRGHPPGWSSRSTTPALPVPLFQLPCTYAQYGAGDLVGGVAVLGDSVDVICECVDGGAYGGGEGVEARCDAGRVYGACLEGVEDFQVRGGEEGGVDGGWVGVGWGVRLVR